MAVVDWIDQICKLAGEVKDGNKAVKSYHCFDKADFPEALAEFPCAITYTTECKVSYPEAGPHIALWKGQTEFHITASSSKVFLPNAMRMVESIMKAFALHRTLGGKVAYCGLRLEDGSIRGPLALQYGSEEPHLGLLALWEVKEIIDGDLTLGL